MTHSSLPNDREHSRTLSSDPPKPGDIRVTIQITNSGFVHFGNFKTEHFEFQGDFPKRRPISLKAFPAKGFQFTQWSIQIGKDKTFVFVSDQVDALIKNPEQNMTIKAEFQKEL